MFLLWDNRRPIPNNNITVSTVELREMKMSFSQHVRELTDGQLVSIEHPATAAPQLIPQKLEIQVNTEIQSQFFRRDRAPST
jgi:hypothetical protein